MESSANLQLANGEHEISPPSDEPMGERIIGQIDPRTLTREQFDSSNERLFHGSSRSFVYQQGVDYVNDPLPALDSDASQTLGVGLYTTDTREDAVNYSVIRQKDPYASPVVDTFLPFQAKMLDFRLKRDPALNASVPKTLFEEWFKYFDNYLNSRPAPQNQDNTVKGWLRLDISDFKRENEDDYLEYLKRLQTRSNIDLRVMFRSVKIGFPYWNRLITQFFLSKGYDGLIYWEGGEGKKKQYHRSYVFYSSSKVGTFESWHGDTG